MNDDFDYRVIDSSIVPDRYSMAAHYSKDDSIRVGIVREQIKSEIGPLYVVEVSMSGKIILVQCRLMTRFGGAHNYEEYAVRPWATIALKKLLPTQQAEYKARSGDIVIVAFLGGQSKEGIILGGINHPGRKPMLAANDIAYASEFNGIETTISSTGEYKRTFKGYLPTNDPALRAIPNGILVPPPLYNPLTGGSFYGFSVDGSYTVSDGRTQNIKIDKTGYTVKITSGGTTVTIGGDPVLGNFKVSTGSTELSSVTTTKITSKLKMNLQSAQVSIKGLKVAIGNDQFELFDGLIKLIDALGSLTVTSPVGTCTPLMTAPTWAAQVLPLKLKLMILKGTL